MTFYSLLEYCESAVNNQLLLNINISLSSQNGNIINNLSLTPF